LKEQRPPQGVAAKFAKIGLAEGGKRRRRGSSEELRPAGEGGVKNPDGSRLRALQDALRGQPLPGGFVRAGGRQLQPPRSLKDRLKIQAEYEFLANACGLASSLSWDYYPPREVPPMPCPPRQKSKPDLEEYYPK
jgi:hypothetical protein